MAELKIKYEQNLPPFLFIPSVSPSATNLKTRINKDGVDINRNFFDDSKIEEARAVMEIVKNLRLNTMINFHEDPEYMDFYFYDGFGINIEGTSTLSALRQGVKQLGIGLLNGVDDPSDKALGYEFINGYRYFSPSSLKKNKYGMFGTWACSKRIINRSIVPEVPGRLPQPMKDRLVRLVFEKLLIS